MRVCALLLAHVSEWKRDGDLNDPTDEHLNDSSQAALAWRDNRKKALPPPDGSGIRQWRTNTTKKDRDKHKYTLNIGIRRQIQG